MTNPFSGQPGSGSGDNPGDQTAGSPAGWQPPPITQPASYEAPGTGWANAGAPYYLQPELQPTPVRRRRLPWILGSLFATLLVVLGGGGILAYQALNGGGTQPDEVIPASAVAFAKIDLDPSVSQKIAAARFLNRLPKSGNAFSSTAGDWRQPLFDLLSANGALPPGVSVDRDIKPWLGKRLAVAMLASTTDGAPDSVVALQSTDDAKARAGIARFGGSYGISFLKGYAILGQSQQLTDRAVAEAKLASLKKSTQYSTDISQLGSPGVASGWVDLAALGKLASSVGVAPLHTVQLTSRLAYTVRFSSDTAELVIKSHDGAASSPRHSAGFPSIADLPASTAVAAQLSGESGRFGQQWDKLTKQLDNVTGPNGGSFGDAVTQFQSEFGITLPQDAQTLLGSDLLVALDSDGLGSGTPKVGIRTKTDGPAAMKVLNTIQADLERLSGGSPLIFRIAPDGVMAATDNTVFTNLTAPSGAKLGSVDGFAQAVPDLATANGAIFVSLDSIAGELRENGATADDLKQLSAFKAIGLTMSTDRDVSTARIRLVAH